MVRKKTYRPFHSAGHELHEAAKLPKSAQTRSSSFKLAFADEEFLLREELRAVRLQLELLKPEITQQEHHIHSTIVVFGSARIPEPKVAKKNWQEAKRSAQLNPENPQLVQQAKIAENILKNSKYYEVAREFARLISSTCQQETKHCDYAIITGGGPGIMEAANRGAFDVNAKSLALNVVLPHEQMPNPYSTPELTFQFHYFAIRKMHFLIRAKALVFFPGGFGTFDELFEALTLLQTGKIKAMPVILFGKEYWEQVVNFPMLVEQGVVSPQDLRLFQYAEKAEDAWQIIGDFYREEQP